MHSDALEGGSAASSPAQRHQKLQSPEHSVTSDSLQAILDKHGHHLLADFVHVAAYSTSDPFARCRTLQRSPGRQ